MSVEITVVRSGRSLTRARYLLVRATMVVAALLIALFLVPSVLNLSRIVVTDPGMSGSYGRGALVLAETVPAQRVRVGDVITYAPPGYAGVTGPVTHRIVEISGGVARTGADAGATLDPWQVDLTQGTQQRAAFSIPYVGYLYLALADRATRVVFVLLPGLVIGLLGLAEYFTRAPRRTRVRVPGPRQPGSPSSGGRPIVLSRPRQDASAPMLLPEYPAARVVDTPVFP